MKCLPECNYSELPNNAIVLRRHMEACSLDGPLKTVEDPKVVWRDGEFVVVRQPEEGEATFDSAINFVRPEAEKEEIIEAPIVEEEPVEE